LKRSHGCFNFLEVLDWRERSR